MKTLKQTLNYQPHGLTKGELERPELTLAHFFSFHELHKTRESLQELYVGWQYHHADHPHGKQLRNMVFFYHSLIDLINASYVISHEHNVAQLES